jgi:hypothetical protein
MADPRSTEVSSLIEEKDYKPALSADYMLIFYWDKDGAKVPDADKMMTGKSVIDSCFVHKGETRKVFKNLWKACGGTDSGMVPPKQVKLSDLREACLQDFNEWLPKIGFSISAFKSLDQDELFMRISLQDPGVQKFYAEKMLTNCQISEDTVNKLNIKYPEDSPSWMTSPPYIAYEDGMDDEQSKRLGTGDTVFKKNYKLQDAKGSLLRQVDKIRIIRKTIMRLIDLDDLVGLGIMSEKYPIHVLAPLEDFRSEWANFTCAKICSFSLLCRGTEQPLLRIRNYFGEHIAYYFAWLAMTIRRLVVLGIIGIAWRVMLECLHIYYQSGDHPCESTCTYGSADLGTVTNTTMTLMEMCSTANFDTCGGCPECEHIGFHGRLELALNILYGMIVGMWSTHYVISWKQKEYTLTVEWNMMNIGERAALRADYRGEFTESKLNANEVAKQFPENWLTFYKLLSQVINIIFLGAAVVVIFSSRFLEMFFEGFVPGRGKTVISILVAVEIQIFGQIWQIVARKLVILENPRTDAEYANKLIHKLAPFGLITTYNTFVFVALAQHLMNHYGYSSPCGTAGTASYGDCVAYLQTSMFTTFATQGALIVVGMAMPFFFLWKALRDEQKKVEADFKEKGKEVPERCFMEKQAKMGIYDADAQITDYLSCVTNLGYVLLFGAAVPSTAFICLIVLLFQFRANAYKLTRLNRRPYPVMVNGIGAWNGIIDTLAWVGLVFYVGIPILNSHLTDHIPRQTMLLWLFLAEHMVVIVKVFTSSMFELEPKDAKLLLERRTYVKDALLMGKDDPDQLKENLKKKEIDVSKAAMKTLNESSEEWGTIDQWPVYTSPLAVCPCLVDPEEKDLVKASTEAYNSIKAKLKDETEETRDDYV